MFYSRQTILASQYKVLCEALQCNYRLQTKLRKGNVFTPICQSFCSQEGVSASVHAGIHTPPGQTSPGQTPPRQIPPWEDTPWQTPPTLSACWDTPLPSTCWDRHGYCCGRYASYWNAFLFWCHNCHGNTTPKKS